MIVNSKLVSSSCKINFVTQCKIRTMFTCFYVYVYVLGNFFFSCSGDVTFTKRV